MRRIRRFELATLWVLVLVAVLTGWDCWGRHEVFSPAKLIVRVVVFGVAAALLSLLLGRMQGRRR